MTLAQARLEAKKLGMVIIKLDVGEYRVNFRGGKEATAYYTDDLADAIGTARMMRDYYIWLS